jgi:2-polyprenyl-3-methyl-5-hydroxy-6-metoxy-1,4-benzoquinol methylase
MIKNVCEICENNIWTMIYSGPIRDDNGKKKYTSDGKVYECSLCKVHRLDESCCLKENAYESGEYRKSIDQGLNIIKDRELHTVEHKLVLDSIYPETILNKTVIDIGAGSGAFLNSISKLVALSVAVEPDEKYRYAMKDELYDVFQKISDVNKKFDYVFSLQVIEHVKNPVDFLKEIKKNMHQESRLIISTPNRNDILMKVVKEKFEPFFYRKAHRFYFDKGSLEYCALKAGLKVIGTKFIHQYNVSNFIGWARDFMPTGVSNIEGVDVDVDVLWKKHLESHQNSDNIYTILGL